MEILALEEPGLGKQKDLRSEVGARCQVGGEAGARELGPGNKFRGRAAGGLWNRMPHIPL